MSKCGNTDPHEPHDYFVSDYSTNTGKWHECRGVAPRIIPCNQCGCGVVDGYTDVHNKWHNDMAAAARAAWNADAMWRPIG